MLLIALTLAIGSAAALLLALRSGISLGFATSFIEAKAGEALGRQLQFARAPRLQLRTGLHIFIDGVSIDNTAWAGPDKFLEMQSLAVSLQPRSLFSNQIVVENLAIKGLTLRLASGAEGDSNIPQVSNSDTGISETPETPETQKDTSLPVAIRQMQIRDVHVSRANAATGQTLHLTIDALEQFAPDAKALSFKASGLLQERPWSLDVDGSSFMSVRTGRDLSAKFAGSLGDLRLHGDYSMADLRAPENLTFNAELDGPIPERIAALSPLLEPEEPAHIALHVRDVAPGLDIDLQVTLTQVRMAAAGIVDDPLRADGIDLGFTVQGKSLERIARGLGLGPSPDIPVVLQGHIQRKGTGVALKDTELTAGEHRARASLDVPRYPDTDGAILKLSATGPDFALYQGLGGLKKNLTERYSLNAEISGTASGQEAMKASLTIGEHRMSLSGILDNFPRYAGSQLDFDFSSPSLQTLMQAFAVQVPETSIAGQGTLSVSPTAVVDIVNAELQAFGAKNSLTGSFNSYPDFDNAKLHWRTELPSLADLGQQLGLQTLGDVPLSVALDLQGQAQDITISQVDIRAEGLQIASREGALRYENGTLSADLRLELALSEMATVLGSYLPSTLPDAIRQGSYKATILPRVSESRIGIGLAEISGPGVSGTAEFEMTRDFQINDKTRFEADLTVSNASRFFPAVQDYAPPETLQLLATTRPAVKATRIDTQLRADSKALISAQWLFPARGEANAMSVKVTGAGDNIRSLGNYRLMPDQAMSYDLDLRAERRGAELVINKGTIRIGDTLIQATGKWNEETRFLQAAVHVPKGDLQPWLAARSRQNAPAPAADRTEKPPGTSHRAIPALDLPLNLLRDYRLDVSLDTGPLGIQDPKFAEESLIAESVLRLTSGDGEGALLVEKLRGSRGVHSADIRVDARSDEARLHSTVTLDAVPLSLISAVTDFASLPRYEVASSLTAKGNDLRALAATLTGDLYVSGGRGTLKKMKLSIATESFLAQLFKTVLPMLGSNDANMQVECSIFAARADNGLVTLDPGFVFRSDEVDLSAQGLIDLRTEKISISFNNRARKGLGISAVSLFNPFVAITGTLARPALGLDIKNSAISGGAAVASAGITIVAKPIFDRMRPRENPCTLAQKEWATTGN